MNPALTTTHAARLLGISRRRVLTLIAAGRLPARKHGRDWLIRSRDLIHVADRKPGRPRIAWHGNKKPAARTFPAAGIP